MKKSKLFICLLLSTLFTLASCDDNSSSSEPVEKSYSSETIASLGEFERVVYQSKPTRISTRQVYDNPSVGMPLNYLMNMTIEYGSVIKVLYSFSYEKLSLSSSDSFTETVSGQYYAEGTTIKEIIDGEISWVAPIEKTLNLPILNLIDVNNYSSCEVSDTVAKLEVKDDKVIDVLGADYDINAVKFNISLLSDKSAIGGLEINYKTALNASVRSVTTYSYETQNINIEG